MNSFQIYIKNKILIKILWILHLNFAIFLALNSHNYHKMKYILIQI